MRGDSPLQLPPHQTPQKARLFGAPVGECLCDDTLLLRDALLQLRTLNVEHRTLNLQNCGTAMRFLTAYCAVQTGLEVTLTGSERMQERPIGQLVDALRGVGADIEYLGKEGFPPLRIKPPSNPPLGGGSVQIDLRGQQLDSTQFVSALMLVGFDVLTDEESPYIKMTRELIEKAPLLSPLGGKMPCEADFSHLLERDWSAASYWYEYVALYGGEVTFPNLYFQTLQGDSVVAEIFESLGVKTEETDRGIRIAPSNSPRRGRISVDFTGCPDLYPAVYMTCYKLGITLKARGTERLRHKESNRLQAFEQLELGQRTKDKGLRIKDPRLMSSYADHRIAMALLVAGYQVDDMECIKKSYPQFVEQLRNVTFVVPYRGEAPAVKQANIIYVFDEGKGKKWALEQGIKQVTTEYVWLTDIDAERTVWPIFVPNLRDLNILLLEMRGEGMQQIEYAAIQGLTLWTAEQGRAVMCSGANLIVNREKWLNSVADLHPEIPSGDDMFLLESFKRKGYSIQTLRNPEYIATIEPVRGWRNFLKQRMRWAGKAPKYTDKDILLCGAITVFVNLLVMLCFPLALIKLLFDWKIIKHSTNPPQKMCLGQVLLWEIIYPWYMFICLVGGIFRRNKW